MEENMDNVFKVEVEALDGGEGYLIRGLIIVAGVRTKINEHRALESEVRTRLGTGFDIWASQVDAE